MHEPLKGGLSEMISGKQGGGNLIIYSGIVGAKSTCSSKRFRTRTYRLGICIS